MVCRAPLPRCCSDFPRLSRPPCWGRRRALRLNRTGRAAKPPRPINPGGGRASPRAPPPTASPARPSRLSPLRGAPGLPLPRLCPRDALVPEGAGTFQRSPSPPAPPPSLSAGRPSPAAAFSGEQAGGGSGGRTKAASCPGLQPGSGGAEGPGPKQL